MVNSRAAGMMGLEFSPMKFNPQKETLAAYALLPKRFLYYLVRCGDHPNEADYLKLGDEQGKAFHRLLRLIADADTDDESMVVGVFELLASFVEQKIKEDPFDSPLMHWLAVEGFHQISTTFMTANGVHAQIIRNHLCAEDHPDRKGRAQTPRGSHRSSPEILAAEYVRRLLYGVHGDYRLAGLWASGCKEPLFPPPFAHHRQVKSV